MSISTLAAATFMMAALSCSGGKESTEPTPDKQKDERSMTVQESVEVDCAEGQFYVEVEANFEFSADPQKEWVSFDRIEGKKVWFDAQYNGQV